MNRFKRIAIVIVLLEIILTLAANVFLVRAITRTSGRMYRVQTNRVMRDFKDGKSIDVDNYDTVTAFHEYDKDAIVNSDYVVFEHEGKLYQVEYQLERDYNSLIYMDIGFGVLLIVSIVMFVYVDKKILEPFNRMSNVSVELAKGNLTARVKEDKNKFFGKFMWGIDMLRENLENNREKELSLQKEKKTLILSISHDIKTPLSAIKLYTKALSDGLYDTPEKQSEALEGIARNAADIEKYVGEIVTASKEDFLNLEVSMGEFYLSKVAEKIRVLYKEKFETLHTEFKVNAYEEFLLKGDEDRLEEVLQNMLENAIKYGDGREVEVSFDEEEDCCLIAIRNSGCSIKEEEIPHLFESFYRGSNSEGIKGSGLGLYICKTLLRMMDGDCYARVDGDVFEVVAVVRKV